METAQQHRSGVCIHCMHARTERDAEAPEGVKERRQHKETDKRKLFAAGLSTVSSSVSLEHIIYINDEAKTVTETANAQEKELYVHPRPVSLPWAAAAAAAAAAATAATAKQQQQGEEGGRGDSRETG